MHVAACMSSGVLQYCTEPFANGSCWLDTLWSIAAREPARRLPAGCSMIFGLDRLLIRMWYACGARESEVVGAQDTGTPVGGLRCGLWGDMRAGGRTLMR